jgi:hypothetical protein
MKIQLTIILFVLCSVTAYAQYTVVLQPGAEDGCDAMVWDDPLYNKAVRNYGTHPELLVHAWTDQGVPVYARSYLAFDFSSLPRTGLLSATLTLHNNPEGTFNGQHQPWSGPNRAWVRRVTTPWLEDSLTWLTQPAWTDHNQVSLPASTDGHQSYSIDVTQLVEDMLAEFRDRSHGFAIVLEQETPYRALVFASSDYHDAAKRPHLELVFDESTAIGHATAPKTMQLDIYPNPASEQADVRATLPPGQTGSMELFDAAGRLLQAWEVDGNSHLPLRLTRFAAGLYWLRLGNDGAVIAKPLVVR